MKQKSYAAVSASTGTITLACALRADKTEPFGIVEPLNSTHFHTSTSFVNLY